MQLIDSDELVAGNVMRHICGLSYVGIPKTSAVKTMINRHNPDCVVKCNRTSWNPQELEEYMQDYDLVIDATGNTNFSLFLSQICVERKQPIMFTAAYRRARIGRIVIRNKESDPCLACYLHNLDAWTDAEYTLIPVNTEEQFIEDGCGSVTEEAVAMDIEAIANFTTRQAVKLLQNNHDGSTLGILINEPLPEMSNDLLATPGMHFMYNQAYSKCSICKA